MTADTWLDDNNRYLAASLAWLRARLEDMARDGSAPVAAVDDPSITPPTAVQPETTGNPTADSTAAARDAAAASDPPPALLLLAQNFGLSDFERDVLLLCAAVELDPEMSAFYAAAQGVAARSYPTFALGMRALADPSWDALSAHRPLRYLRL